MGILQESIEQTFEAAPRQLLQSFVERKLASLGVVDTALVERIVTVIDESDDDSDEIDIDLPFELEFTQADSAELARSIDDLVEGIPVLVERMSRDFGRDLADGMRRQWQEKSKVVAAERAAVRGKIAKEWGESFSDLRLLIELCSGYGHDFNEAQQRSRLKHNAARNDVLSRLHIRACRIAEEIALLLENGHAEGAEARWRTLLEVSVTALLIKEGGDLLAERYLDHAAIEQGKALDDHDRALAANPGGTSRVRVAERKTIEAGCARLVSRHGKTFKGMYGWAAGQLGLGDQPQFHNLQEAAGALAMKLEYRLACFGTHASPRKLAQPMHKWDPTVHVPGAFSAGFENPGANTAHTLVQITAALFDEPWDLDMLVELRVIMFIRDDVRTKLHTAARKIARAEQLGIQRAIRRSGSREARPLRLRR